jgi:hypothetical protein
METKQEIASILNHLYWFKDKMDVIDDEENYKDFVESINRLQILNQEV